MAEFFEAEQKLTINNDVLLMNLQTSCLNQNFGDQVLGESPPYYYEQFLMDCKLDPSTKLPDKSPPISCPKIWSSLFDKAPQQETKRTN